MRKLRGSQVLLELDQVTPEEGSIPLSLAPHTVWDAGRWRTAWKSNPTQVQVTLAQISEKKAPESLSFKVLTGVG